MIEVEGVNLDDFVNVTTFIKFYKGSGFSDFFSKAKSSED